MSEGGVENRNKASKQHKAPSLTLVHPRRAGKNRRGFNHAALLTKENQND